ncbi:undecaprenyl/decaprenyl-phosphate alpha-N-acetylglucosaminyl 1-phosphate transferase [Alphaproteobacteria bacterium]|nr:undecaprenyl/decaprenyl-phosphate alpha-N-acetylglucosaminyl 1-phosphate transferase [Alphaproteobacteria bacterium]
MLEQTTHFYLGILAALAVFGVIWAGIPISRAAGLLDNPSEIKQHDGAIPLVGGPAIFLVCAVGGYLTLPSINWIAWGAGGLLILTCIWDDLKGLGWLFRLIVQATVAIIMVEQLNLTISNPGFGIAKLSSPELQWAHKLLATIAIVAAINALNMLDGIDGLCSVTALLVLQHISICLILIDGAIGDREAFLTMFLSGCILGFLGFNLTKNKHRKVFLGDSGSAFLGLMCSIFLITVFGGSAAADATTNTKDYPVLALWIFALPISDMFLTSIRRLLKNKNVFSGDRSHLHHRLLDAGATPRQALTILSAFSIVMFWFGFWFTTKLGNGLSIIAFLLNLSTFILLPRLTRIVFSNAKSR